MSAQNGYSEESQKRKVSWDEKQTNILKEIERQDGERDPSRNDSLTCTEIDKACNTHTNTETFKARNTQTHIETVRARNKGHVILRHTQRQ